MLEIETPEEREIFSAMEQSSIRKEGIRQMDKYQSIMEELALARMLIRELGDRLAKLEKPWVALTDEEIADCAEKMEASDPTDSFWREFFRGIEAKLKEKNT